MAKKESIFQKIFSKSDKEDCCSVEFEEVKSTDDNTDETENNNKEQQQKEA